MSNEPDAQIARLSYCLSNGVKEIGRGRPALAGRAERRGSAVLGHERILEQAPDQRPSTLDHSPAPLVHAASKAMRQAMQAAYRFAADQLRAGVRDAAFPRGSFPPDLPAVALSSAAPPTFWALGHLSPGPEPQLRRAPGAGAPLRRPAVDKSSSMSGQCRP